MFKNEENFRISERINSLLLMIDEQRKIMSSLHDGSEHYHDLFLKMITSFFTGFRNVEDKSEFHESLLITLDEIVRRMESELNDIEYHSNRTKSMHYAMTEFHEASSNKPDKSEDDLSLEELCERSEKKSSEMMLDISRFKDKTESNIAHVRSLIDKANKPF